MAPFPVTEDIDEHVALEFGPEFHSELYDGHQGFNIITVDMENGRLYHFGHIGAIGAGTGFQVIGSKPDLVIYDQVDGSSCFITGQLRHLYHFIYHTLPGNGRIPMDEDRQDLVEITLVIHIDPGTDNSLYKGIYRLQVGWIR